jgi:formate dehydrogenase subunit delta
MNIDLLIKMANEISDFFAGTAGPEEAAGAVANHLRRYWEPRMRAQMLAYYEQRQGAGLSDIAHAAVAQLAAASRTGAPGSAPPAAASASAAPRQGPKA